VGRDGRYSDYGEDDHSRLFLGSTAYPTVKAQNVVGSFFTASDAYGLPASFLSDNAAVFSGRSRRGKVALELEALGIEVKHSTHYHRQTCGKFERLHQTSRSSWPSSRRPPLWPHSRPNSTPFASTTTTTGLTAL